MCQTSCTVRGPSLQVKPLDSVSSQQGLGLAHPSKYMYISDRSLTIDFASNHVDHVSWFVLEIFVIADFVMFYKHNSVLFIIGMILVTSIEKDNGIYITWNTTMTVTQFTDIRTRYFFPRVAELLNAHCNEADNFASCCPDRGSRYCHQSSFDYYIFS